METHFFSTGFVVFVVAIYYFIPTEATLSNYFSSDIKNDYDTSRDSVISEDDFAKFLEDMSLNSRETKNPARLQELPWSANTDFRSPPRQSNVLDYLRLVPDSKTADELDYEILYDLLESPDESGYDSPQLGANQSPDRFNDLGQTDFLENEDDKQRLLVTALLEDMLDDATKESQNEWSDVTPEMYSEEENDGREKEQDDISRDETQILNENINDEDNLPNSDGKKERGQEEIQNIDEVLDENSEESTDDENTNSIKEKEKKSSSVESNDVDELRSLLTQMADSEINKKSATQDDGIELDSDIEKSNIVATTAGKEIKIDVKLPGVSVSKDDTYLCTAVKLSDYTNSTDKPIYIVEYVPHAKQAVAHHMLMYGCTSPGITRPGAVWNCGGVMENAKKGADSYPVGSLCGTESSSTILWAWAKDAPSFNLPEGVGFKIGRGTGVEYLVLQVHYKSASVFKGGFKDHSAVTVVATKKRKPRLAGVYILATSVGTVPPHQRRNFDIACRYKQPFSIHPFAFRTHAHALGVENIGFRIRDSKWTFIGAKSPQLPEAFYPVINKNMTIRYGDWLAARCEMDNFRSVPTSIGFRHTDEMCNFYIMFWVDAKYEDQLDKWGKSCNNGFPWVHWSSLPGYYN